MASKPLVLLTGPTGFVGAHIFFLLLSQGYRVRGTIHSPSKSTFLEQKQPEHVSSGALTFIVIPNIQMWKSAKPDQDLVTFCPPMIYGPSIQEIDTAKGLYGLETSVKRLLNGITGKEPAFAPKVATPGLPACVDVRDFKKAHLNSLSLPKGTSECFLFCGGCAYYEDGLAGLREQGVEGLGERGQKCDPSNHFAIDVSKAKQVLGMEFIPFHKTVEDVWGRAKELDLV